MTSEALRKILVAKSRDSINGVMPEDSSAFRDGETCRPNTDGISGGDNGI